MARDRPGLHRRAADHGRRDAGKNLAGWARATLDPGESSTSPSRSTARRSRTGTSGRTHGSRPADASAFRSVPRRPTSGSGGPSPSAELPPPRIRRLPSPRSRTRTAARSADAAGALHAADDPQPAGRRSVRPVGQRVGPLPVCELAARDTQTCCFQASGRRPSGRLAG